MKALRTVGAALFLGLFPLLLLLARPRVDPSSEARLQECLRRWLGGQLAAQREAMMISGRLSRSFDALNQALADTRRSREALSPLSRELDPSAASAVQRDLASWDATFAVLGEAIEDLKTDMAVLENSSRYLPTLGATLEDRAVASDPATRERLAIEALLSAVYRLQLVPDPQGVSRARDQLRAWRDGQQRWTTSAAERALLAAHVEEVLARRIRVEQSARTIRDLPIDDDAHRVLQGFARAEDLVRARSARQQTALFVVALVASGLALLGLGHNLVLAGRSRRALESALTAIEERNERIDGIFRCMTDVVLVIGAGDRVLMVNPAVEALFGHPREAVLGQPIGRLLPELVLDGAEERTIGHLRSGGRRTLLVAHSRLRGDETVVVVRDYEARAHAERELQESVRIAREASVEKSRFLAAMSHELRTPLNAIIGYAEILLEDLGAVEGTVRSDLESIRSAGTHQLALVNDILDLSKVEAGRMTLECEEFSLQQLLVDLEGVAHPLAAQSGNVLRFELAPELGMLRTDRRKLRQILTNLLANAMKFTERGSVWVRARRADERVEVDVVDSGIGIPAEHRDKLFLPFSQVGASTRRFAGTGLGLVLSREFARLMGGDITVESEAGQGSTFRVVFPAVAPSASPPGRGQAPDPPAP